MANNYVDLPVEGGAAVTSLNGEVGDVSIVAGTGITVTPAGQNITVAISPTTGSGSVVLATSPTLVTPALGTPSALVGTNITGTAAGLTAGNATLVTSFGTTFDGGGIAPVANTKSYVVIPYACTINSWSIMADQSGSCVIDLWKVPFASFPPLVGNTITAAALPTLSSQASAQSSTLSGWTTSIAANDVIAFNVNSATTVTRVTISIKVTRI